MPKALKMAISLEDFQSLYIAKKVHEPDADELEAAFKSRFPHGVQPEDVHFAANPNDLCLINYTSGSTGSPKGVMLNGRSISNNVEVGMKMLPVDPGQRLVSMLPLAHMFGQVCELLYPDMQIQQNTLLALRLTPPDVHAVMRQYAYNTFDFDKAEEIIAQGKAIMNAALEQYERP